MPKRNSKSPWNPAFPTVISPMEYEKQVVAWLLASGGNLDQFKVEHLKHWAGSGGDYEFDAIADFTILQGAKIRILVECKRYSQPVEREKLLVLWAKLQDVKAHKAMMFATCGFQSGALSYAASYGIATIAFVEGSFLYETRSSGPSLPPPSWVGLPQYTGLFMSHSDSGIQCNTIDLKHMEALSKWLQL